MDKQNNSNLSVLSHSLQIRISQRKRQETRHIISNTESSPCINLTNRAIAYTAGFTTERAQQWCGRLTCYNTKYNRAYRRYLLYYGFAVTLLISTVQSKPQARKYFTPECAINTILALRKATPPPMCPMCFTVTGLHFLIQGHRDTGSVTTVFT